MGARASRAPRDAERRGARLERLIIDTSILVAAERGASTLDAVIDDGDGVVVAAVTVAELLVGVELASRRRVSSRREFVSEILESIPVQDYDLDAARAHAMLLAHVRRTGRPRGAHDLLIAATALATQRVIATADESGFSDLPGVRLRAP